MKRIAALDGFRGLALLVVFAHHAHVPGFSAGSVGVDIFFVLSGFLITSIIAPKADAGTFRLGDFYLRRARRLVPALAVMVLVYAMLSGDLLHPFYALTYTTGYVRALTGDNSIISHTWSLGVEEHFYLVWPLVILFLRPKYRVPVLAVAYVAFTLWRGMNAHWFGWEPTYFRTDARLSGLVLGSLLACGMSFRWIATLIVIATGVSLETASLDGGGEMVLTLGETLAEAAAVLSIAAIMRDEGSRFARLFSPQWLRYLGGVSYAAYLFQYPLIETFQLSWLADVVLVFPLTIGFAHMSRVLIEQPALTWRPNAARVTPARVALSAAPAEANDQPHLRRALSAAMAPQRMPKSR